MECSHYFLQISERVFPIPKIFLKIIRPPLIQTAWVRGIQNNQEIRNIPPSLLNSIERPRNDYFSTAWFCTFGFEYFSFFSFLFLQQANKNVTFNLNDFVFKNIWPKNILFHDSCKNFPWKIPMLWKQTTCQHSTLIDEIKSLDWG